MKELNYSPLLTEIMNRADRLSRENRCSTLTRDYIVVAALELLTDPAGLPREQQTGDEFREAKILLTHLRHDPASLRKVLDKWKDAQVPMTEKLMLSVRKSTAVNEALAADKNELPADVFLKVLLQEETDGIKMIHVQEDSPRKEDPTEERTGESHRKPSDKNKREISDEDHRKAPAEVRRDTPAEPKKISDLIAGAKSLQKELSARVLGQQHAVTLFSAAFFQSGLQALTDKERVRPRATFLFAGPPGVGKTFLSEEAARILGLPFRRFDMSEYAGPGAPHELSGINASFSGSAEGQLTGFVKKNPHCIVLLDEIEKASLEVIHLFLQVLDAGRLRDGRTNQEVSFTDTILIFTTNAGKELYENSVSENLSGLSRDVILDALARDINPRTREPFFPAAICSRFAAGNVVMFNHLGAATLRSILARRMEKHAAELKEALNISVTIDPDVPTALLFAEGASVDARTAISRADSTFGGELYELFRLVSSGSVAASEDDIVSVHFSVDLDQAEDSVRRLFSPGERLHALCFAGGSALPEDSDLPVLHTVSSPEEADVLMEKESIPLAFLDLFGNSLSESTAYLNREDRDSPGRNLLHHLLTRHPDVSVLLLETDSRRFSDEEKVSYLRRGVQGFLDLSSPDWKKEALRRTEAILQEHSLSALARSNELLRFETAQLLTHQNRNAEIVLFDLRPDKAIKAEDADNIMSCLSTPKERFEDVIGADDAKDELKFFVSFMKEPARFRKQGAAAPRGVLLYGPPGTGKTMLAKAFAAESGATFIAARGSQFFGRYIGDGQKMLTRLFAIGRRYAPSVIFIDEIDTIGRARTGADTDLAKDTEQILTALFAEMDGFSTDPSKPVFVLGATNYSVEKDAALRLDEAFLRRFDRRILISLPSRENRRLFLGRETVKKSLFRVSEAGLDSLAERSVGMSLAQLASVLNLALRSALRQEKDQISDVDLNEAFETFNSGEEKKWDAETTLRTARHEAGHALLSWLSGECPSYLTIVSRGDHGGYMQHEDTSDKMGFTRAELLARIRTSLGGRAAEIVCYGRENGLSTGASGDLAAATSLARQMLCAFGMDEDFGLAVVSPAQAAEMPDLRSHINRLLSREMAEAIRLTEEHRGQLDTLVSTLLEKSSLQKQEIEAILSK